MRCAPTEARVLRHRRAPVSDINVCVAAPTRTRFESRAGWCSKIDLGEWKRALTYIQKGKAFAPRPERSQHAASSAEGDPPHEAPSAAAAAADSRPHEPARAAPPPVPVDEISGLEVQLAEARARSKQSARDCQSVLAEQGRLRARLKAQQAAAKEALVVAEVANARLQVQLAKAMALIEHDDQYYM